MKRIPHGPHIYVHQDKDGNPCVTTDDYELFDMVEDYLTEDCDFDFEDLYMENWPLEGEYTILVESGITFEKLVESIQKLDINEIERIYLLNNSPKNS